MALKELPRPSTGCIDSSFDKLIGRRSAFDNVRENRLLSCVDMDCASIKSITSFASVRLNSTRCLLGGGGSNEEYPEMLLELCCLPELGLPMDEFVGSARRLTGLKAPELGRGF